MMPSLEERVVELELRWMAQEDFLRELSAVVAEQRRELEALEKRVDRLERALREVGAAVVPAPDDSPPPHY